MRPLDKLPPLGAAKSVNKVRWPPRILLTYLNSAPLPAAGSIQAPVQAPILVYTQRWRAISLIGLIGPAGGDLSN